MNMGDQVIEVNLEIEDQNQRIPTSTKSQRLLITGIVGRLDISKFSAGVH